MNNKCRICGSNTEKIFNKQIIGKYQVDFFQCQKCNFVQTEYPYWLDEVYEKPINTSDTGLLSRNISLSKYVLVIILLHFNRKAKFLDYGGGYGVLTRLMRDYGINYFWDDPYTINLFSKGFEWNKKDKIEFITCFELFEHLESPLSEIEKMFQISDTIFFSTELIPKNNNLENWEYLGLKHGQHISFYSIGSLQYIAKKHNAYLYTNGGNLHIISKEKKRISIRLISLFLRFNITNLFKKLLGSKTLSDSLNAEEFTLTNN